MKSFLFSLAGLLSLVLSTKTFTEEQKIYEVDLNREITSFESLVPAFYQEYGPYLFFLSQPGRDSQCCSTQRAYPHADLWRLDSRNNQLLRVVSKVTSHTKEKSMPYAIVNDRIVYSYGGKLMSTNLSGGESKNIWELGNSWWDSYDRQVISYNGYAYFPASKNGKPALLQTDGSSNGTNLIDLCIEESCYHSPRKMLISGGKLFFVATSPNYVKRIWSVDSKQQIRVFTQAAVSNEENIFPVSTGIQFNSPNQLWFTDGTESGSYPINFVKDGALSKATDSVVFDDLVVAAAEQLYVISDKGKGATISVEFDPSRHKSTTYIKEVLDLIIMNDKVYFIAEVVVDDALYSKYKLMSMDGTLNGLYEVYSFTTYSGQSYKFLGTKGNKLLVLRNASTEMADRGHKTELWISDGTTDGTKQLPANGIPFDLWNFQPWSFFQDELYFSSLTEEDGVELWRTDGSNEGTRLAKAPGFGQTRLQNGSMITNGSEVYYLLLRKWYGERDGHTGSHTDREIWKTDVVTMETEKLDQWLGPRKILRQMVPIDRGQFWWVDSDTIPDALDLVFFNYDTEQTESVINGMPYGCSSFGFENRIMAKIRNIYLFEAPVIKRNTLACQLWRSDGTAEGTYTVTDFPSTYNSSGIIRKVSVFQDEVYFNVHASNEEFLPLLGAIYKSDGTKQGTHEAFRIPDEGEQFPPYLLSLTASSKGVFAVTELDEKKLWFWQGEKLFKLLENASGLSPYSFTRFKQDICFVMDDAIWMSDGTQVGTSIMLKPAGSDPKLFPTSDFQHLLFATDNENGNRQLWVYDGKLEAGLKTGPELEHWWKIKAISGKNIYVAKYRVDQERQLYENLMRFSLIGEDAISLGERKVSSTKDTPEFLGVKGRVFIGHTYGLTPLHQRYLGGPFVTARLGNGDLDGDGILDNEDSFPLHFSEYADNDNDGIGDNSDSDDDNDGAEDKFDLFPLDGTEWADNDNDGIGNRSDSDDDNDGVTDWLDSYPRDGTKHSNEAVKNEINTDVGQESEEDSSGGGAIQYFCIVWLLALIKMRLSIFVKLVRV